MKLSELLLRRSSVARYSPLLLALLLAGCPAAEGDDEVASNAEGELACNKTPVECRTAFADQYEGTYEGDATGRVMLDIDVLGGIVGTATLVEGGSTALMGKVNEFGQVDIQAEDGTEFTGQFSEDKQLVGSWTRDDGTKGTFEAVSTTAPPPDSSGDPTGDTGGSEPPGSSSADLAEASKEACRQLQGCEGVDEIDCDTAEGPLAGCESVAGPFYQCEIDAGCAFMTECEDEALAYINCLIGVPAPTEEPADPGASDPGTAYEPTGNPTYDEATITCSACAAEASACHDDPVCWDYAECSSGCTEVPCLQRCLTLYEAGYELWLASVDCRDINCPAE